MIVASLLLVAALYTTGLGRLWRTAGVGQGVRPREAVAFAGGWLTLAAALASPMHEWSEALFAAHMVQHELIMAVGAPLIAFGAPTVAMLWAFPLSWRRRMTDALRTGRGVLPRACLLTPGALCLVHAIVLWLWHIPTLFEAALEHEALHAVQHASFFAVSVLFWWTIARGPYASYGASVFYLFGTALQTGVLGALLAFSSRLWYPAYAAGGAGLSAFEDQELAGLVMWVPASVVFTAGGLRFLLAWLRASERRTSYQSSAGR